MKTAHATADIAAILRVARDAKALSQRELSKLSGVPQSHISKIETGEVDLRLSSLIELARVLDLELTLVPRKSVPAVQSVIRSTAQDTPASSEPNSPVQKEVERLSKQVAQLVHAFSTNPEIAQLGRLARDFRNLSLPPDALTPLREANKTLNNLHRSADAPEAVRRALADLYAVRNAAAHSLPRVPDSARPAYSLDEDDHG